MNPKIQAEKFVNAVPPAVSGQGGHNATYHLACELIEGFGLSDSDAKSILDQWNQRCQPLWTSQELDHKVASARAAVCGDASKIGWRVNNYKSRKQNENCNTSVPAPIKNGIITLLETAFKSGEGVSISGAILNDDFKSVPDGAGIVLSRENWIEKLAKKENDPNKIFSATDNPGAFIRINPMSIGKSPIDSNVTEYRHALIEFDKLDLESQWNLIKESNVPCSAVIFSGKKSLHAWVKVDAKDRSEYDTRVLEILNVFKDSEPDPKNKNPSRLSRLPDSRRGETFQSLLAVNIGAKSFTEWKNREQTKTDILRVNDLIKFDFKNDPNTVIGKRWLCRGHTCLLFGPSGVGKSTLTMQLAVNWSIGDSVFGIKPKHALKSLIIQAENDQGDLAEQISATISACKNLQTPKSQDLLNENMVFVREVISTGLEFCKKLKILIEIHKPDLVWIDPLLSYIGDDISDQKTASTFLRNWLAPILEETGVVLFLIHHVRKPQKDDATKTLLDLQYLASGSAEICNFSRATIYLESSGDGTANLHFVKRGKRAEAVDIFGNQSLKISIEHSKSGPVWEIVAEKKSMKEPVKSSETIETILGNSWFTYLQGIKKIQRFLNSTEKVAQTKFTEIKARFEIDETVTPKLYRIR